MNIEFREAKASDAEKMIELLKTVGGETDNLSFSSDTFNISPDREARFIEKFAKSKNDIMLVALDGEKIVGNAVVERNKILRFSHRAEISITVLKDFWGQGIGSRLMQMMIDFAKSVGIEILYLEARADNTRAINLYKKYGFSELGIYERFFKIDGVYHDAILMTKEL